MGIGQRLYAFPWDSFQSRGHADLRLDVSPRMLRRARGFDAGRWPDWNGGYYQSVDELFGRERRGGVELWRATDLLGASVRMRNGGNAGHITDVLVNFGPGGRNAAVLELDRLLSIDKHVAVPLQRLRTSSQDVRALTVDIPRHALHELPAVAGPDQPLFADEGEGTGNRQESRDAWHAR